MIANMLKSLIANERIETTIVKAKELRRHADKMITIAKKEDSLSAKRLVKAKLMIRYNTLTSKEKRKVKSDNDTSSYNGDRKVIKKLFTSLKDRFSDRNGGYTRIIKKDDFRKGDGTQKCIIEYLQ
ncbi:MAG: hypothetical protein K940chlam5_01659, partial [Candidatus Anoxychlamydiales bacterium]|nr:hypothetical protein [Candidatus Anoxychlamydiales bacterium]